jgi:hypothetical protein
MSPGDCGSVRRYSTDDQSSTTRPVRLARGKCSLSQWFYSYDENLPGKSNLLFSLNRTAVRRPRLGTDDPVRTGASDSPRPGFRQPPAQLIDIDFRHDIARTVQPIMRGPCRRISTTITRFTRKRRNRKDQRAGCLSLRCQMRCRRTRVALGTRSAHGADVAGETMRQLSADKRRCEFRAWENQPTE